MSLHRAGEDYLKAIYVLQGRKARVRSADVARLLNRTRPSVSTAIRRLQDDGFVSLDDSKIIRLTATGETVAKEIYERHCLLTRSLTFIGVDAAVAEQDACKIEHEISAETLETLRSFWKKDAGTNELPDV